MNTGQGKCMKNEKGQVVGMIVVMGLVMIIAVLTIATLLLKESKWTIRAQKNINALHICDAALDRVIWKLQEGPNWENPTSISGYTWSDVHSDVEGGTYKLSIVTGDILFPPGNTTNDRSVTIEATTTVTKQTRRIIAVLNRAPLNASMIAGGAMALSGSAELFWADAYDYGATGTTPVTLSTTITLGANRTKYYSTGAIRYANNNYPPNTSAYLFPNQTIPPMPPKPEVDFNWFKAQAKNTNTHFGPSTTHPFSDGSGVHSAGGTHYPPTDACIINAGTGLWSDNLVIFVDTTDEKDYYYVSDAQTNGYNAPKSTTNPSAGDWVRFGTSTFLRCTLMIMGPVYFNGGGGTVPITSFPTNGYYPQDPDLNPNQLTQVAVNGFLYVAGNFKANGNPKFYGTVMVDPGAVLDSGNMSVYYRSDLSVAGIIGRYVKTKRWKEMPQ